jgi:predicted permease
VGENFEKQLTALIMKIILPCMIVKSMMGTFSWSELKHCGQLVVIAIVLWAITFGLGQVVFRLMGKTPSARIMRFSMMYTNFTFVGIPVIEALYGDLGIFYFVVFVVPYRMVYYSSAEPLLSPPNLIRAERTLKEKLKGWFSIPVIAVFVGLILYLTQIQLPAPIAGVINSLGSCASPLGMLLCGMSLGKYPIKRLLRPRYFWLPLVRNLFLPGLFLALSLLIGLEKELAQVVVMFTALPVASLIAAFTIQYDPNEETQFEAAAAVLLSTAFAAVTIPLWAALLTICFPS